MIKEYNDRVVQTRVSSLVLANAMALLQSKGIMINNQSKVLRGMLRMCADIAVKDPSIKKFISNEEAACFLDSLSTNECSTNTKLLEEIKNYNTKTYDFSKIIELCEGGKLCEVDS